MSATHTKPRVVVAMSGGVDSSVAALLLHEAGYDVVGLFMRNGIHVENPLTKTKGCCSLRDADDARRVADRLGVPFYAVDFSRDFQKLIGEFVEEYNAGRTPNPCVRCNQDLKFGKLLAYAESLGAEAVATGHYAQVADRDGRRVLRRGLDVTKDQSYVLFPLVQAQLRRTLLPIGGMTKAEVRERARAAGLCTAEKRESMEICFVPDDDYGRLIAERTPDRVREGELRDVHGRALGRHPGYQHFTIGQRHGLRIALGRPAYVVQLLPEENVVVVGFGEDLLSAGLVATRSNWVSRGAPELGATVRVAAKIRSHHDPTPATATVLPGGGVRVEFDEPQRAVTPGQAVVLYDGDEVVAGGWIDAALPMTGAAASRAAELRATNRC
ncbi:MAG: tRNA 2-thiouridine(34) synthase MnmA [Planctomycetes bacterium]|nr:tRNA 2-thiouridine(34) synthase MnmA [Planctomycetota bacterium]